MRKLLVADDEPSMRVLVKATVESDEYEVIEAGDGDQAWELIEQHQPHLVLLDVQMPGLTGFDIARSIRRSPNLRETKIIMLTAKAMDSDIQEGLSAGADHYLTKPFSPFQLLRLIEETMGDA